MYSLCHYLNQTDIPKFNQWIFSTESNTINTVNRIHYNHVSRWSCSEKQGVYKELKQPVSIGVYVMRSVENKHLNKHKLGDNKKSFYQKLTLAAKLSKVMKH